ncbi:MAG: DNA polymerase [Candidatus Micrarchaeaceae archaeon]
MKIFYDIPYASIRNIYEQSLSKLVPIISDPVNLSVIVDQGNDPRMGDCSNEGDGNFVAVVPHPDLIMAYKRNIPMESVYKLLFADRLFLLFPSILEASHLPPLRKKEDYLNHISLSRPPLPPSYVTHVACDLETSSLEFQNGEVTSASVAWRDGDHYVGYAMTDSDYLSWYIEVAEKRPDITLVFHNYSFDLPWILKMIDQKGPGLWWYREHPLNFVDTMVFHNLVENSKMLKSRSSLDRLSRIHLGESVKTLFKTDEIAGLFRNGGDLFSDDLQQSLMKYNAADSMATIALWESMSIRFSRIKRLKSLIPFVESYHKILCEMTYLGVPVDQKMLSSLAMEFEITTRKALKELMKHPLVTAYQKSRGEKAINFSSSSQITSLLHFHDSKITSSDRNVLNSMNLSKEIREFLDILYDQYRTPLKANSTYVRKWMKGMKDGKIFPSYTVSRTGTYRTSSEDPNIQNVPKILNLRTCIRHPEKKTVAFDYKQLEVCIFAALSQDQKLISDIHNKVDLHLKWTKKLYYNFPHAFRDDQGRTEEETIAKARSRCKGIWTFALFYGAGVNGIARNLGLTTSEEKNILKGLVEEFWGDYKGVKKWQDKITKDYEKHLVTAFPTGFIRMFPLGYNELINGIIQSVGASVTNQALYRVYKKAVDLHDDDLIPRIHVHDELVFFLPEDKLERLSPVITQEMCLAPKDLCGLGDVKFSVDRVVADYWSKG